MQVLVFKNAFDRFSEHPAIVADFFARARTANFTSDQPSNTKELVSQMTATP
jgi:hypothetical protein